MPVPYPHFTAEERQHFNEFFADAPAFQWIWYWMDTLNGDVSGDQWPPARNAREEVRRLQIERQGAALW